MFGGVGAGGELAFHGRLGQHAGIGDERIDSVDAGVQVALDLVEVAVVVVGDPGRNVALRNPVDILGGDIQRAYDRVERGVDAFDDFAEVALMFGGVGARSQLALHGRLGQHTGIGDQRVDGVDAGVQVVLDFVEVAVVVIGDPGGMSPFEIRSTYSAETLSGPMTASSVALTPSTTLRKSP